MCAFSLQKPEKGDLLRFTVVGPLPLPQRVYLLLQVLGIKVLHRKLPNYMKVQ